MKIIRPMDGIEGVATSNAPDDPYSVWEPVGRNFFPSKPDLVIGTSEDFVFFSEYRVAGSPIYRINADTGEYEALSYIIPGLDVRYLAPSPDGQFLAVISQDSRIRVYNTTTGALAYQGQNLRNYASWSSDSTTFSYQGINTFDPPGERAYGPFVLSVSNWSQPGYLTKSQQDAISREYPSGTFAASTNIFGIASGTGECYYSMAAEEFYQVGGTSMAICKSIVGKLTVSGANTNSVIDRVEGASSSTSVTAPQYLWVNNNKGHVLGYKDQELYAFSTTTLSQDTDTPPLAGIVQRGIYGAADGSEVVFANSSVQPYLRRYDGSNYTIIEAIDSKTGGYTDRIGYTADYIAFADPLGGYGLIDLATGDRVTQVNPSVTAGDTYTYANHNYEALEDNNDRPDLGAQLEVPTWLNLGAINPLRMFDSKLDSRTTAPSPLTITVTPGAITNGLALFNVSAASVQVVMDDPTDGVVYDSGEIQMLDNSAVNNWWDFFFAPYLEKADLALIDLPPYPDATLTITLSSDGGDVALGELVLGRVQNIGEAQYGTSVGIIDSSTKERDVFGNFEIIERKFSKRAEFDVSVPTSSASGMQRILAQYRATPVVWVGNMGLEATIVYGFYRDFQINFSHYSLSDATITVEGL